MFFSNFVKPLDIRAQNFTSLLETILIFCFKNKKLKANHELEEASTHKSAKTRRQCFCGVVTFDLLALK